MVDAWRVRGDHRGAHSRSWSGSSPKVSQVLLPSAVGPPLRASGTLPGRARAPASCRLASAAGARVLRRSRRYWRSRCARRRSRTGSPRRGPPPVPAAPGDVVRGSISCVTAPSGRRWIASSPCSGATVRNRVSSGLTSTRQRSSSPMRVTVSRAPSHRPHRSGTPSWPSPTLRPICLGSGWETWWDPAAAVLVEARSRTRPSMVSSTSHASSGFGSASSGRGVRTWAHTVEPSALIQQEPQLGCWCPSLSAYSS